MALDDDFKAIAKESPAAAHAMLRALSMMQADTAHAIEKQLQALERKMEHEPLLIKIYERAIVLLYGIASNDDVNFQYDVDRLAEAVKDYEDELLKNEEEG